MSASDQINTIIDTALLQANVAAANAGEYANKAIAATDTIHLVEGAGDITGAIVLSLMAPPAGPSVPNIDNPAGAFAGIDAAISGRLIGGFNAILGSFFPDIQDTHNQAVEALEVLMATGASSVAAMQRRLDRDASSIDFLKSKFGRASIASDYVISRVDPGRAASGFMQAKFAGGGDAAAFLARRFALGDASVAQLLLMITSGGTALPASVEDQVWERDRARVLKENRRVKETTVDKWAAFGYPLPPGALVMQLQMIEADAQDKISQQSRDVAIKQIDVLIENIRTAVNEGMGGSGEAGNTLLSDASSASKALLDDAQAAARLTIEDAREAARIVIEDSMRAAQAMLTQSQEAARLLITLRQSAISSAVEYMRALALGPQVAAGLASSIASAQASAAEAVTRYFTAQVNAVSSYNQTEVAAASLRYQPLHDSGANRTQLHAAFNNALIGVANAKSNAALGAAQATGNIGAAAVSTLNAIASLTSSD